MCTSQVQQALLQGGNTKDVQTPGDKAIAYKCQVLTMVQAGPGQEQQESKSGRGRRKKEGGESGGSKRDRT